MRGFPVGYVKEADSQSRYEVLGIIFREGLVVGFLVFVGCVLGGFTVEYG